jgi:hypothetical protein
MHTQTKGRYWQRCCQQPSGCSGCCKEEGTRGSKGIPARPYGDWSHDIRHCANKPCHFQRGQQLPKRCRHSKDSEGQAGWRQALRAPDDFCVYFELETGVWGVVVHAWVGIVRQTAYDGVSKLACWPKGSHHMNQHCNRIRPQRYRASPCAPASLNHRMNCMFVVCYMWKAHESRLRSVTSWSSSICRTAHGPTGNVGQSSPTLASTTCL